MEVPKNILKIRTPKDIGAIGRAVTIAGLFVDHYLEKALYDQTTRELLEKSVRVKDAADVTTVLDSESESVMAKVMLAGGYKGGIFGEEGIVHNPLRKTTLVLDGIDGTEAARSRISGFNCCYGPSAGIFMDDRGLAKPLEGAVFLPRQRLGIYGSLETGKVFEFRVEHSLGEFQVNGVKELPKFDQDRTDVKYMLDFFLSAHQDFPPWLKNLYVNANKDKMQNLMHAGGSSVGSLTNLVRECGDRRFHLGASSVVCARDIYLHDIMGVAPAILALGGVVGNLDGEMLGKDIDFISEVYRDGGRTLRKLKTNRTIIKTPIGPLICAQNIGIYDKVRDYMLTDVK